MLYMKISSIVLVLLLAGAGYPLRAFPVDKPEKETQPAKVKSEIAKLGTGADARVEVELRDKTKIKGHISEVGDESFAVVDDKSGTAITVSYPQVKRVRGNNLSTGAKIAIGIGIVLGLALLLAPKIAQ